MVNVAFCVCIPKLLDIRPGTGNVFNFLKSIKCEIFLQDAKHNSIPN